MNKHFLEAIEKLKTTPERETLVESVKKLYDVCERKAQIEGKLGRTLAIGALGGLGALGVNHVTGNPVDKALDSGKETVIDLKNDVNQSIKNDQTLTKVQNYDYYGDELREKGWKFVPASEKPGVYSDSLNGMALADIDKHPHTDFGWLVSPDGTKYYSTVTGKVFQMPKGQTFADVTPENRGQQVGVGTAATGAIDYDPDECSLRTQGMNGCKRPITLNEREINWFRGIENPD